MIFTETAKREAMDIQKNNQIRIRDFGIHPLCKKCLWNCKAGNAKGLINFYCSYFEEK